MNILNLNLNGWNMFYICASCFVACFLIAFIVGIVYCFIAYKSEPWPKNHRFLYGLMLPVILLGPMYMIVGPILCIGYELKNDLLTRVYWWADNLFSNYGDNVYALMHYIVMPGIALISSIASVMFCIPKVIAESETDGNETCQESVNELQEKA